MNAKVLQQANDHLMRAQALLRSEQCIVADDVGDCIQQLLIQITDALTNDTR